MKMKVALLLTTLVLAACLVAPAYAQDCTDPNTGEIIPDPGPIPGVCDSTSVLGWVCPIIASDPRYSGFMTLYDPGEDYDIAIADWYAAFPDWAECTFITDLGAFRKAMIRIRAARAFRKAFGQ